MGAPSLGAALGAAFGTRRAERGVAEMAKRLKKHHGERSSELGEALWGELSDALLARSPGRGRAGGPAGGLD